MNYDVIIIGGGAAGLMCAIEAGKRGRSVLVVEHSERLGKKILISGGGRCNFTNADALPVNYLSGNPNFCKSALARYTPNDFIVLVEKHGIGYHEKKLGQLFCDISSKQIVELLQDECDQNGVKIQLQCRVTEIQKNDLYELETTTGKFSCQSLVIATGGLSFPKIGATDFGHRVAEQFGLKLTSRRPGLVPLTWNALDQASFLELSGVSLDVSVSANGRTFRENILFTHRGLSGPAILQISSYMKEGDPLTIDLFPDKSAKDILSNHRTETRELVNILSYYLPKRFVQKWCEMFLLHRPINRFTPPELEKIAHQLQNWKVIPAGTEGYSKAEVTLGGVDTGELSSKTMEARHVPGLFFVGEVVDVTGWLGGFNFQWAWASGFAAGQFV